MHNLDETHTHKHTYVYTCTHMQAPRRTAVHTFTIPTFTLKQTLGNCKHGTHTCVHTHIHLLTYIHANINIMYYIISHTCVWPQYNSVHIGKAPAVVYIKDRWGEKQQIIVYPPHEAPLCQPQSRTFSSSVCSSQQSHSTWRVAPTADRPHAGPVRVHSVGGGEGCWQRLWPVMAIQPARYSSVTWSLW